MTIALVIIGCLVGVVAAALWLFVATGNRLAALDARCRTAFADIDVHLKRRADLIPGLVECVKGFARHEAEILGDVADARKASVQAAEPTRAQAEAALGRKIGMVISLAEKYPDLAASSHFRELRGQLVDTEERITASRRFFNLAVEEYNATLVQFPGSLVASRRKLSQRRPYDLGVERVLLDEAVGFRFSTSSSAAGT